MFTHPLILRQLNLTADFLRRGGEMAVARRLIVAGDAIRKLGWTEEGRASLMEIFRETPEGEPSLDSVTFGAEHQRRLGGGENLAQANSRLSELRFKLKELSTQPLRRSPLPDTPRPRSPDLA